MRHWFGLLVPLPTTPASRETRRRLGPPGQSSRRLLAKRAGAALGALALGCGLLLAQQREKPAAPRYEPPQVISAVDAAYPIQSVAFGTVVLEVELSATGKVDRVAAVRDIPPLTDSAEQAVRQWKFKPARLDGRAVASSLPVAFTFVRPDVWPRLGVPR
jgi:periplasmic protein TonB